MATSGGVDRDHDQSLGPKLAFFTLHAGLVIVCIWLAFGRFDWADPLRAKVLAGCALAAVAILHAVRHRRQAAADRFPLPRAPLRRGRRCTWRVTSALARVSGRCC